MSLNYESKIYLTLIGVILLSIFILYYISNLTSKQYLHLSHTRSKDNTEIEESIKEINYNSYDMLWLGGDLAYQSSVDDDIMNKLDELFDLGNANTLWSLGNHDYSNINRIEKYTHRPPYYSIKRNGLTIVVLDTQCCLSRIEGEQKKFLFKILDNIEETTQLVILHHKLIWMYDNERLKSQTSAPNGGFGDCEYCINPNNFNAEIYPKLVEIRKKGIEILCIGGDIGKKVSEFEYHTPDGITFLASGIKLDSKNNKALIFRHNLFLKSLTWKYKLLEDL